ncbi:MAG: DNA polymerase III subunit chi [Gammaproteobacteria bacterium]|nr:DNA polymerase III subunit chi [Gammaproteobacteria bacterium]
MTRIDFYDLTQSRYNSDGLVCKLCHKAYQSKQNVLLLTANQQQTDKLDRMLWTSEEESFLPHDQQEQESLLTPVLINHQADPRGERQLLINLSAEIPLFFAQFERVIELVSADNKELARSHYSYYKDRGYELNHHKL